MDKKMYKMQVYDRETKLEVFKTYCTGYDRTYANKICMLECHRYGYGRLNRNVTYRLTVCPDNEIFCGKVDIVKQIIESVTRLKCTYKYNFLDEMVSYRLGDMITYYVPFFHFFEENENYIANIVLEQYNALIYLDTDGGVFNE